MLKNNNLKASRLLSKFQLGTRILKIEDPRGPVSCLIGKAAVFWLRLPTKALLPYHPTKPRKLELGINGHDGVAGRKHLGIAS